MEFIAKRKLYDIDKQFIDEIKKDMLRESMDYIWLNYPELLDNYWFKYKYIITQNFTEIKLAITAFKEEMR